MKAHDEAPSDRRPVDRRGNGPGPDVLRRCAIRRRRKCKRTTNARNAVSGLPGAFCAFAEIATTTPEPEPEPEWIEGTATAYCSCEICCGEWALNRPNGIVYTASGAEAVQGVTIAADWSIYPPGTVLFVEGLGEMVVQDRGGAIQGQKIDVYFESHDDALQFGRQNVRFYIVND